MPPPRAIGLPATSTSACPQIWARRWRRCPASRPAFGEIEALLYAARRLIYTCAADIDAGNAEASRQATLVKYHTTTNGIRAVDIMLSLIGNPGLFRRYPLERYHRDILCSRIHTPQDDQSCSTPATRGWRGRPLRLLFSPCGRRGRVMRGDARPTHVA